MEATELTWADQIDLRASLRAKRDAIRRVLQRRFGQVTSGVEAVISNTQTEDELDALLDRVILIQDEDELI